jgi:hypothetical protein
MNPSVVSFSVLAHELYNAEPELGWYVKIVTGSAMNVATRKARFDDFYGRPEDLATVIDAELFNLAADPTCKAWGFLSNKKSKAPVRSTYFDLELWRELDQEEEVAPGSGSAFASDRLAFVIEKLALSADSRAEAAQDRLLELVGHVIQAERKSAYAEAELHAGTQDQGGAAGALAQFGPALLPMIAKMAGSHPAPITVTPATETEFPELDAEQASKAADDLVDTLVTLCGKHPGVVTPERLSRLAPILGLSA